MSDRRPGDRRHPDGPRRANRPRRLLIVPMMVLVSVVLGTQLLRGTAPMTEPTTLNVPGLPPVAGEVLGCTRGHTEAEIRRIGRQLDLQGRVTSAMVTACPSAFDGRPVRFAGELVGDLLHRDGGAWVQVNDDVYALRSGPLPTHGVVDGANSGLAVWLPDELLPGVTGLGGHGWRGDVVLLHGRILRSDPADGGGLTLRADGLTVLLPAAPYPLPLHREQAFAAAGLLTLAGSLTWLRRRRARVRNGPERG